VSALIPPPDPPPPRWTGLPLPPYRYLPGLLPHPFRDPAGHAWCGGGAPELPSYTPVAPWTEDERWLRGLELAVHRYYWEAHEVWEGIWKALDRSGPDAQRVQSLVQLAAAALKLHAGQPALAHTLTEAACARLEATGAALWWGLDLGRLLVEARACVAQGRLLDLRDVMPVSPPRVLRVVAGAVVQGGRVLVARKAPGGPRGGLWELPGGKVEVGESDREALERELREELGIEVRAGAALGEVAHVYPDLRLRLSGYVCTLVHGAPVAHEHAELRWVHAGQLGALDWAPADLPLLPALAARLSAEG
jgi:mutator protein MutT